MASSRVWERGREIRNDVADDDAQCMIWEKKQRQENSMSDTAVQGMMGKSTGTAGEDTEMYVDTGANGSILKRQYAGVSDMKVKVNGSVKGVTGDSIAITHTAVSDRIGNVYIVPGASANLLSVGNRRERKHEAKSKDE